MIQSEHFGGWLTWLYSRMVGAVSWEHHHDYGNRPLENA
jgi:hypothetical protein